MKILDKLQRRYGRFAVPHVTEGLIVCQALTYFFYQTQPGFSGRIALLPRYVLQGEVWRLVTFLCTPPLAVWWLALLFWYMFYLTGTTLENTWGAFRYNVYLLVGWLATVAVSFLRPDAAASIHFLQASVFLAFAQLFPNFEFLLFFVLPVKVKWLALLQWLWYLYMIIVGDAMTELLVVASVCNFFAIFRRDIWLRLRAGRRRIAQHAERTRAANTPRHTCTVCGVTSLSDPKMSFRYCSKCAARRAICAAHIHAHQHVINVPE